jgi:tetratricopeptide (TPR) repeat protein/predicted Ser/Thr protein kinase
MTEAVQLARLLCADQRTRWQLGERVRVEAYLEQNRDLDNDPEGLLDLIYNEVVLRQQGGERPCLSEYVERFARFEGPLRLLFEVHDALEKGSSPAGAGAAIASAAPAEEYVPDTRGGEPSLLAPPTAEPGKEAAVRHGSPQISPVPGYEILGELGRGGMGVVYKARQLRPRRLVAVKMLLGGAHASPEGLTRFRAEAEAVARLSHANVVRVYEVGESNGLPFFSMEYVQGQNLSARINATPQPADEAARLVVSLARAMQTAHDQGVIHRDLKPANVLLAEDGTPKITDFGLAKMLDEACPPQTRTGDVMGTPSYMAPEQAAGNSKDVGPATDTYALGTILYELLTGRPPFKAETTTDTLLQVLYRDPIAPSRMRIKTPRDLETICLKCLEKDPRRRYATAGELAEDLQRFLDGKPVLARPVSLTGRAVKWARRRPGLAATLGCCFAAVTALLLTLVWHNAAEQRRHAVIREEIRETIRKGQESWLAGDWAAARSYLDEGLSRLDAEPSLAELRPDLEKMLSGAKQRLAEQAEGRYVHQTEQAFQRCRDEAMFHSMNALTGRSLFTGLDPAAHRAAADTSAREALALVGLDVGSRQPWSLDPRFRDPTRRGEIISDCYTLMLVLADVVAGTNEKDEQGRSAEALRILERASQLRSPTGSHYLRRARHLRQRGGSAAESLSEAAAASPGNALDYFLLGDELYRQGDVAGAMRAFESAVGLEPGHFWAQCYLGACHLRQRQWHRARACFTVCLVQRQGLVWPHLLRGYANREIGAWQAADADFDQAAALVRQQLDEAARYVLLVNRGFLRLDQGKPEEAEADFLEAARLRPDEYSPHLNLVQTYERLKNPAEAERHLGLALRLNPPPLVLANRETEQAVALCRKGKYAEAGLLCQVALRRQPGHTFARGVLAQALLKQDRYKEAAEELDRYLKDGGPVVADVYRGRGTARMKQGDFLGAGDDFTRALELSPDAELYVHRGWASFFADAWRPALRDFETALKLDPKSSDAHTGRGLSRVMLGHYREAVADAGEALRRKPASPEMMHNLACVFALALTRLQADAAAQDRPARAAEYRKRCLEAIHKTLDMVPAGQRAAFWRERIAPDDALASVRETPEFKQLQKEYGAR